MKERIKDMELKFSKKIRNNALPLKENFNYVCNGVLELDY